MYRESRETHALQSSTMSAAVVSDVALICGPRSVYSCCTPFTITFEYSTITITIYVSICSAQTPTLFEYMHRGHSLYTHWWDYTQIQYLYNPTNGYTSCGLWKNNLVPRSRVCLPIECGTKNFRNKLRSTRELASMRPSCYSVRLMSIALGRRLCPTLTLC